MKTVTKENFFNEKLKNMIKWIEEDKLLDKGNQLLLILKSYLSNFNSFYNFIQTINPFANDKCEICDIVLGQFFGSYNIKISDFKSEHIDKFKKYLTCFIKTFRN